MRVLRFIVNNQRIYPDPKCDFSGLVKHCLSFHQSGTDVKQLLHFGEWKENTQ